MNHSDYNSADYHSAGGLPSQSGEPLVSVIVPVYNQEADLPTCIESLLRQTYRNLEILLINDCSTDGSLAVIQRYAALDPRIVIIDSDKNCGTCVSRNKGLAMAHGEFVGFVDDDDAVEPRMYEDLLAAALKADADVAVCGCIGRNPDGSVAFVFGAKPGTSVLSREEAMRCLHDGSEPGHMHTTQWNKLYRVSAIGDLRVDPACGGSEDYWFIHQALLRAGRVVRIPEVYYNVNLREGSISRSPLSYRSIYALEAHRRIIESLELSYPDLIAPVLVRYLLAISNASLRAVGTTAMPYSEARRTILRHFRYVIKKIRAQSDPFLRFVLWQQWTNVLLPRLHGPITAVYSIFSRAGKTHDA